MLRINRQSGLLLGSQYHCSPNQDDRPDSNDITSIVIHNISLPPGEFGGRWIDDLFLNKLDHAAHPYFTTIADLKVSAHLLIRRHGEIIQYVPFNKRAWHAGVSSWRGRERCNDFTVGIEMEGCDDKAFEKIQYQLLSTVIQELMVTYAISRGDIAGHSDIAPDRKTDPGRCFDWSYLNKMIDESC